MRALEINNVSKFYKTKNGKVVAVDSLSFHIDKNCTLGLIGANGAGKSTLIKCILGLIRETSGSISLFGVSSRLHKSRLGVSYVPESPRLNAVLSPNDVLIEACKNHSVEPADSDIDYWLDRFGITHVKKKPIKGFSKGMAQRTALAAAFVTQPKMIILDEPLSGLDPVGRREVVDILAEYKATGGTLLFTSHVLHDVERLADDYCVISKGKLVEFKSAEELRNASSYIVKSLANDQLNEQSVLQENLWQVLEQLKQNDEKIVSVTPELNLEKLFFGSIS